MSEDAKTVSNFYTLTYDLGNGRNMTINGNFHDHQSDADKYASLSAVVDIVERERARLSIDMLELRQKQQAKQLSDMVDHLTALHAQMEGVKGRDKAPNVKNQIDAMNKARQQLVESMKEGEGEIALVRRFVDTGVRESA